MSIPERFLFDNLVWTSTGDIWATWRLTPLQRPVTENASLTVAAAHRDLFRHLARHEFCLNGALTWTDPTEIVDAMAAGLDLSEHPVWADEIDATLDQPETESLGRRVWFLSIKLNQDQKIRTHTAWTAALNKITEAAGLMTTAPGRVAREWALRQAKEFGAKLPAAFQPRPVTVDEQIWLRQHLSGHPTRLRDDAPGEGIALMDEAGRAALGELVIDEAATSDLLASGDDKRVSDMSRTAQAWNRRVLKIGADTGETVYQSHIALGKVPRTMTWPAYEFLGRIDDTGVPVDVAIRGVARTRHAAMQKNQRAIRQTVDQLDNVEGGEMTQASTLMSIEHSAQVLVDYNAELAADEREVEIQALITVTVSSPDFETTEELAGAFVNDPVFGDFTWVRPVGRQEDLLWAARPGGRFSSSLNAYRQLTHASAFAASIPVVEYRLGRTTGIPLAVVTGSPLQSLAFLDLHADTQDQKGNTVAFIGKMGAGKTMAEKRLCAAIAARGGRIIATDNSDEREWVTFVNSIDGVRRQIVDTAHPKLSLDPLRILPPEMAGQVAQSFLLTLLNLETIGVAGTTLAKVLKPAYMRDHQITSCGRLARHLAEECDLPEAAAIADRIAVFADIENSASLASAIFDPDLPPADLSADILIIGTCGIALPNAEEMLSEHLFRQLPPHKVFGRALYALIARLARLVCFSDRARDAAFIVDEFHHMSSSPEASHAIDEYVRESRRANAWLITGSHDPEADYPNETVRNLIQHRIVLLCDNINLAQKGVEFLGVDPKTSPEEFADLVKIALNPGGPGCGLYADQHGNVGEIRLLRPAYGPHREAASSNPPEHDQEAA